MKEQFWEYFNPVLLQNSKTAKDNNKKAEPFVTCKQSKAITDTKKKTVWKYYSNPLNKKPTHKHAQEWFSQEF